MGLPGAQTSGSEVWQQRTAAQPATSVRRTRNAVCLCEVLAGLLSGRSCREAQKMGQRGQTARERGTERSETGAEGA